MLVLVDSVLGIRCGRLLEFEYVNKFMNDWILVSIYIYLLNWVYDGKNLYVVLVAIVEFEPEISHQGLLER